MKAALQEEDEEDPNKPVQRDAKGKEILSPEEKAKKEEKARKAQAEVRSHFYYGAIENTNERVESGGTRGEGGEARGESREEAGYIRRVCVWPERP